MAERRDGLLGWARIAALLASTISLLYLSGVLAVGALLMTIDWDALACFDGDEPACQDQPADHGLGAVHASSWLLAALGLLAVAAAFAVAMRANRLSRLGPAVAGLCAAAVAVGTILQARL